MELTFENLTSLGGGANPSVLHLSNNGIYLIWVYDGRLKGKLWRPDPGNVPWDTPDFESPSIITKDKNLSRVRLKNVPRVGIYGAWHQDEVEEYDKTTPERQRFAIWDASTDISKYLNSGTLRLDLDNVIASGTLEFDNPNGFLSGEVNSKITPGNKIELYFTMGDSSEYPMGVLYVDRSSMSASGDSLSLDLRNISGKRLKDQTFDENNSYPKAVYAYNVENILLAAGVTKYKVQQPDDPLTAWQCGIEFSPDMDMLTGLKEFLKMALNWVSVETLDGEIIVGSSVSYTEITGLYGNYEFVRGPDLISRSVSRDDDEVYSRVCYQSKDTATDTIIRAYSLVEHSLEWATAPHKTLYVSMADDTASDELQTNADELALRLANAGVTEQFSGPFRPYIIPGDEATITEADSSIRFAGVITTVEHSFGKQGFKTSFTVDSSGRKGKPQLKDMISPASTEADTSVKRLY